MASEPCSTSPRASWSSLTLVGAAGDKVYVNAIASGWTALAVSEAGTDAIAQANAAWLGLTDVAGASTAVLASGLSGTTNFGGGSLSTVIAATGAQIVTLGTLPPEITTMDPVHWRGGKGLLRAFTDAQSVYGEVFF